MRFKPLISITLVITLVIGLTFLITAWQRADAKIPPQDTTAVQIPPTTSGVNGVEIISVEVINKLQPALSVVVHNGTPREITTILLFNGTGGIGNVGKAGEGLAPYSNFTITYPIASLKPDKPLAVAAVRFADGTIEGYPSQAHYLTKETARRAHEEK